MSLGFSAAATSASPHPVGDPELRADVVRGALVVGVRVGQDVRRQAPRADVLDDLLAVAAGLGVDQQVARDPRVDRVRREAGQHPDVVGDLLQWGSGRWRPAGATPRRARRPADRPGPRSRAWPSPPPASARRARRAGRRRSRSSSCLWKRTCVKNSRVPWSPKAAKDRWSAASGPEQDSTGRRRPSPRRRRPTACRRPSAPSGPRSAARGPRGSPRCGWSCMQSRHCTTASCSSSTTSACSPVAGSMRWMPS